MPVEQPSTAPTPSEHPNHTQTEGSPTPNRPALDGQAKAYAVAEAQGTLGTSTYEKLLGSGKHLWDSPEDFERFMEILREMRAKE